MTEELTSTQEVELREALVALRNELEEALSLSREAGRPVELDQAAVGRVSRGDAMQQQQLALANRRSLELRLSQVRAALASHDEGAYGHCRKCDEPIGYRRLRSRPETPFCVTCQAGRERS